MSESKTVAVDYSKYTYTKDHKIEISGEFFNGIVSSLATLSKAEIKDFYQPVNEGEDFFAQTPIKLFTPNGMLIQSLLFEFEKVHRENVDSGNTITREELSRPKLELIKP